MSSRKVSTQRKLFDASHQSNDVVHVLDDESGSESSTKKTRKRSTDKSPSATKKPRASFFQSPTQSTPRKSATKGVIVTPPQKEPYVPKFIHKTLDYKRQSASGDENHSDLTRSIFQWIQSECEIPQDFETNRAYGPLSGSSYEDRVIRAYRLGQLSSLSGEILCTACGESGHDRDACPTLV